MSQLPVHISLGIEQPAIRVLEWYLACVLPQEYDTIRNELASGREIVNPIDAFERIIRNNQPIPTYKSGLDYANNCFPRSDAMAKEASRWMLRWEPELTKTIGRILRGEQALENQVGWSMDKHIAYSLMSTQMMASNWEHKKFVDSWNQRLSYRTDITPERRQVATARAYWTLMGTVHPDLTPSVWSGILARANPKHRESLEAALAESHTQLTQRAPSAMPGLPTQAMVAPPRIERNTAVPAQ
jgi:hypothetical protein